MAGARANNLHGCLFIWISCCVFQILGVSWCILILDNLPYLHLLHGHVHMFCYPVMII